MNCLVVHAAVGIGGQFPAGAIVCAKFEMFKNAQNSIIWSFTNLQFCPRAHQQKIGHQCKRQHEPQDNLYVFSHNQIWMDQVKIFEKMFAILLCFVIMFLVTNLTVCQLRKLDAWDTN